MKCAKMKMRYLNAHQDDKQYHLPRKQWAEITIKEIEHFLSVTNKNSLLVQDIDTPYEPEYLKEQDKNK